MIGKPQHLWHFVLNRADARTGLTIPAIERTVGINVDVAIPSSRSVPAVAEPGRAARAVRPAVAGVAGDARSSCSAWRRSRPPADTRPVGHLPAGGDAMKLSERMKQRRTDGGRDAHVRHRPTRAADAAEAKAPAVDDPVSQLKRRAQEALILRMGPALWDADDAPRRSSTRRSCTSSSAVLKDEKIPLNDAEREQLVGEIIDQVLGYGPIERYLDDPTVTEVMVNGLDGVYIERDGQARGDRRAVLLRAARAPGDRPHRRAARPPHRRVVADGRRPPPRRFTRQRGHPAARDRRPAAHHPQVHASAC